MSVFNTKIKHIIPIFYYAWRGFFTLFRAFVAFTFEALKSSL